MVLKFCITRGNASAVVDRSKGAKYQTLMVVHPGGGNGGGRGTGGICLLPSCTMSATHNKVCVALKREGLKEASFFSSHRTDLSMGTTNLCP